MAVLIAQAQNHQPMTPVGERSARFNTGLIESDKFFTGVEGSSKFMKICQRGVEIFVHFMNPGIRSGSFGVNVVHDSVSDCGKILDTLTLAGKVHKRTKKIGSNEPDTSGKVVQLLSDTNLLMKTVGVFGLIPGVLLPHYRAIKEAVSLGIAVSDLFMHIKEIEETKEQKKLCEQKLKKWKERIKEIHSLKSGDHEVLKRLSTKYRKKIRMTYAPKEKVDDVDADKMLMKIGKWERYLAILERTASKDEKSLAGKLAKEFTVKRKYKLLRWGVVLNNAVKQTGKSIFGVVVAVSKISLIAFSFVVIAFAVLSSGVNLCLTLMIAGLAVNILNFGKFVWCELRENTPIPPKPLMLKV